MLRDRIINIVNNISIVYKNKKIYPLYEKTTNLDPLERRVIELINLALLDLEIIDEDNNAYKALDIHKNITIKAKMQQEISKIIKKIEEEQI
jgi:hypothetical protein